MADLKALQVFAERQSRKSGQEDVFRLYDVQLQMDFPQLSEVGLHLLNDTNAILDRHLQVK